MTGSLSITDRTDSEEFLHLKGSLKILEREFVSAWCRITKVRDSWMSKEQRMKSLLIGESYINNNWRLSYPKIKQGKVILSTCVRTLTKKVDEMHDKIAQM